MSFLALFDRFLFQNHANLYSVQDLVKPSRDGPAYGPIEQAPTGPANVCFFAALPFDGIY